jgi:hypothetical protein
MSGGLAPIGALIATAPIATSMEENDVAFLLDLRVAPAQRRCGDRGPARSQDETGPGCSPALRRHCPRRVS